MATTLNNSLQDYLASSFRPDREYVDGNIKERHVESGSMRGFRRS
jgi:hypothetical protein